MRAPQPPAEQERARRLHELVGKLIADAPDGWEAGAERLIQHVRPRLPLFTLREGSEEGRAYLPQRRVPQRVVALVRARVLKKQVQGT